MRVIAPRHPRYDAGAPIAIHVPGGHGPGRAAGPPAFAGLGFVEIYFAFPGGGRGEARSGGTYDLRGPKSIRALADVILFATGRLADEGGRKIDAHLPAIRPLAGNCGLVGSSHGGNACGVAMALHGRAFPDLAFYVSMESPYGEGAVNVELGSRRTGANPAYDPETGTLDLSRLAWSPELTPSFALRGPRRPAGPKGGLFFDMDGDGRYAPGKDFAASTLVVDVGHGLKAYYSPRLIRRADARELYGKTRPAHLPTVEEAEAFWRYRDAAPSIPAAVRNCPRLAVIVYGGQRDHVQAVPDHPHVLCQVEGFRRAGARFVRLNPDRAYVERILRAAGAPLAPPRPFADEDAGKAYDHRTIRAALEPAGPPPDVFVQAAVCELADRTQAKEWAPNLERVLFPDAPWRVRIRPRPRRARPEGSRPPRPAPSRGPRPEAPGRAYGSGTREIAVDGARTIGEIRSLLGVNKGPVSFPRPPRDAAGPAPRSRSYVESYRALGIDFIRTHDFYGPTDWYVIFPDWSADPEDPASYDFRASDERIRAIVENGFACLYRLGTSWKGRQRRPINDPPGTIRDRDGRVTHRADRDDFRKWARICVQTVRHYTEGWKDGFRFPILYWEIWNEPDLASQFWTGTPEQYYAMYEEAAKAIKAANPRLRIGGPACTGGLPEAYVEGFLRYCRDHAVPLDFFSWHSYGGREAFNPHSLYRSAIRIRRALDRLGFRRTESFLDEWNAGIGPRQFAATPAGAAYYASTLVCLLEAGVDRAFQYCGDDHPALGLHDMRTGRAKICGDAFRAWKRLLVTPVRIAAEGSDERGYAVVAGRDAEGRRVRILVSDFQSGYDGFRLRVENLPWPAGTPFEVTRRLLDAEHGLDVVEEVEGRGRALAIERPFRAPAVCLIEIERRAASR